MSSPCGLRPLTTQFTRSPNAVVNSAARTRSARDPGSPADQEIVGSGLDGPTRIDLFHGKGHEEVAERVKGHTGILNLAVRAGRAGGLVEDAVPVAILRGGGDPDHGVVELLLLRRQRRVGVELIDGIEIFTAGAGDGRAEVEREVSAVGPDKALVVDRPVASGKILDDLLEDAFPWACRMVG